MLELEVEGNPIALEHVARIQQSQTHLHRLLDELRYYSGSDPMNSGYTTVFGGDRFPYHGAFVPAGSVE